MNPGITDMDKLCELVRLHRHGRGAREIARLLKISPNTERKYRKKLDAAGLLVGPVDDLPALDELRAAVGQARVPAQERSSLEGYVEDVEALQARGHGPTAIHELLSHKHDDYKGSLSALKRLCARLAKARGPRPEDVAIPVVTDPGEVAQVDFGYVGKLYDPASGRRRKAWVFVMVLGFSRHMYAEVVFDQSERTWAQLHVNAFAFFGGVPRAVVPDNLKAAVIRAAFRVDETHTLNRAYREVARHYGFVIDPAPPRAPEKKGKVERNVRYVRESFFIRYEIDDVEEANRQLPEWLVERAGSRVHGTTGQRPFPLYEAVEKPAMLPLPTQAFRPASWKNVTVGTNAHVVFDRAFWSVPWNHLGKKALVRATAKQVEIYVEDRLVASHARGPCARWHTIEDHLPEGRRDQRHRSRTHWERRADSLGTDVGVYIRAVFDEDEVQQPIRRVASMLKVLESVPPDRAQAACRRAARFRNYRVDALKRILREGLEHVETERPTVTWSTPPRFARPASAFGQGGRHGGC